MVVRIKGRRGFEGVVIPFDLNVETKVIELPSEPEYYFIGGFIDLSNLVDGDKVVITEYVDGKRYAKEEYVGRQENPLYRLPVKTLKKSYKVTLTQTFGVIRSFPYDFVQFLTEVV